MAMNNNQNQKNQGAQTDRNVSGNQSQQGAKPAQKMGKDSQRGQSQDQAGREAVDTDSDDV